MERKRYLVVGNSWEGMATKVELIVFDTNILIEWLKDKPEIIDIIEKIPHEKIAITSITYKEIIVGSRDKKEQAALKKFLDQFSLIHVDEEASKLSVELVNQFTRSHHIQIPDALIGAICILYNIPLLTLNTKDFRFLPSIKLYQI